MDAMVHGVAKSWTGLKRTRLIDRNLTVTNKKVYETKIFFL